MNPTTSSPASAALLLLLAAVTLAGCQRPSVGEAVATDAGSPADDGANVAFGMVGTQPADVSADEAADLARIRAGTSLYQQFERAVAAGFVDPSGKGECVTHPEFGGMGIHFVNFDRYETLAIDAASPEILLYEPQEDGSMKLVGVEFAVNAEAWHAAGSEGPPSLAGVAYDPPNPEAESPIVQTSWTLHVWTWQSNPNGRFFPFNPRVECPGE